MLGGVSKLIQWKKFFELIVAYKINACTFVADAINCFMNPFQQIPFGKVMGTAHTLLVRNLAHQLKQSGVPLTPDQYRVMMILWEGDSLPQCKLAESLQRDRASVTRILDTLERDGLVVRVSNEADRRMFHIALTELGRSYRLSAMQCSMSVTQAALQGLTDEEAAIGFRFLHHVIKNLKQP